MSRAEYLMEQSIIRRAQEIARRQRELLDELERLLNEATKENADAPQQP